MSILLIVLFVALCYLFFRPKYTAFEHFSTALKSSSRSGMAPSNRSGLSVETSFSDLTSSCYGGEGQRKFTAVSAINDTQAILQTKHPILGINPTGVELDPISKTNKPIWIQQDASCPINAIDGPFSDWSACSTRCGGGMQSRTQSCSRIGKNGGVSCKNLVENRPCNNQTCSTLKSFAPSLLSSLPYKETGLKAAASVQKFTKVIMLDSDTLVLLTSTNDLWIANMITDEYIVLPGKHSDVAGCKTTIVSIDLTTKIPQVWSSTLWKKRGSKPVSKVAVGYNGNTIVSLDTSGMFGWFNANTGDWLNIGNWKGVDVSISPNSPVVAVVKNDTWGTYIVTDVIGWKDARYVPAIPGTAHCAVLVSDNRIWVAGCAGGHFLYNFTSKTWDSSTYGISTNKTGAISSTDLIICDPSGVPFKFNETTKVWSKMTIPVPVKSVATFNGNSWAIGNDSKLYKL